MDDLILQCVLKFQRKLKNTISKLPPISHCHIRESWDDLEVKTLKVILLIYWFRHDLRSGTASVLLSSTSPTPQWWWFLSHFFYGIFRQSRTDFQCLTSKFLLPWIAGRLLFRKFIGNVEGLDWTAFKGLLQPKLFYGSVILNEALSARVNYSMFWLSSICHNIHGQQDVETLNWDSIFATFRYLDPDCSKEPFAHLTFRT